MKILSTTVMGRIDSMQSEVIHVIAQKDDLENELSSSTLQRNLLSNDLSSLTSEHDTLKGAYQVVEFELASLHQKNHSNANEELKKAKEKIANLNLDYAAASRKILDLEKGADLVVQLTVKAASVQEQNCELENQLKESKETIEMYKEMTASLKKKIRELGTGDSKDFMDTFEEVMREEMMAMKVAFENKLKLAKEDAQVMSRRHQQAIQTMLSLSPSSSATFLDAPRR